MKKNKQKGRPKGVVNNPNKIRGLLANMLVSHRLNKKLGQDDVANHIGVSGSYINHIESSDKPLPWKHVRSIAELLDIELDTLAEANLIAKSDFKKFMHLVNANNS